MIRKVLLLGSVLGLTACGGGGSDGGGSADLSPDTFVPGSFHDADVTKQYFPRDRQTHGSNGHACAEETKYFETDAGRVRVYGSSGFSELDFQAAATLVENNLDRSLAKFNLNWSLFQKERGMVTMAGMQDVFDGMIEMDDGTNFPDPDNNDYGIVDAYAIWKTWDDEQRAEFIASRRQFHADQAEQYDYEPEPGGTPQLLANDKVVVCLASGMGGYNQGEGTIAGINMPPEHQQYKSDIAQIVVHELTHFIQNNLYQVAGYGYMLPRWFSEGQSVYNAGQRMASPDEHYNFEPQDVVHFDDETGDAGVAYNHYGLAYRYIRDHNSVESINDMMRLMKDTVENPVVPDMTPKSLDEFGNPNGFLEHVAFQKAFDATMVDHNGDPLTIERFRTTYHDLMNAAY